MGTAYFSRHDLCRAHDMGRGHPEAPGRLQAIEQGLGVVGVAGALDRRAAPDAPLDAIKRVHDAFYVDQLSAIAPTTGRLPLDGDTLLTPHTLPAARHAAGAGMAAVDAVLAGEVANAFCAVRPPGHHAEYARAMGFCFFNNAAIAAAHALAAGGLDRVAILDFDVHHGNGTEDVFRHEPRVLFCSTYQNPLFPFTSDESVPGRLIKTPLRAGTGGAVFKRAVERDWLPALDEHEPELILISAGFDAHRADPLADLQLEAEDFEWLTERIADAADRYCDGRIVSLLEGGYALDALAASAAIHIKTLVARSG
ncbi:histone deacetylase family protein [Salinisphaera sp.]|uniref:histone deacetylase family protein n=1 Tax=Salinisphaera sp. TaxID=1914330 RepID=UPI002D7A23DE|nr:histone deacetylase family protein [Salinisphaera sp.]HET7314123.1 histone deacetylase family protein [Salinisphaera sp.]